MWSLPRPGIEPISPALAGGFLTTGPPGKSRPVTLMHTHSVVKGKVTVTVSKEIMKRTLRRETGRGQSWWVRFQCLYFCTRVILLGIPLLPYHPLWAQVTPQKSFVLISSSCAYYISSWLLRFAYIHIHTCMCVCVFNRTVEIYAHNRWDSIWCMLSLPVLGKSTSKNIC